MAMRNTKLTFHPVVAAAYVVLLMVPELLQLNLSKWWDPLVSVPFNLFVYSFAAWLLCALAAWAGHWQRWAARIIHGVLHMSLGAYAASTVFLVAVFHRHWDAFAMQFVHETNSREAGEFVHAYLLSPTVLGIAAAAIVLFGAEWLLCRKTRPLPLFPASGKGKAVLAVCGLAVAAQLAFFSTSAERNYDLAARWHTPIKRNAVWTFWQSCLQYAEFQNEYARCAKVQSGYREHVTCREKDADMVFVIGESFNRHYSNLYDGRYNTNPLLKRREREGRLFAFSNTIATDNGTSQNFKYVLSMANVADKGSWCDKPLLPALLRRCGYNVVFYSNQFAPNDNLGQWDASMGFVNHPLIAPYIIDHRNTSKYTYDLGLLADYAARRHSLERPRRNLCIFHLYGQHVDAASRFPHSFARFSAKDVSRHYAMGGNGVLSDDERQQVADYLNATAYNDVVVDSIMRMFDRRNAVVIYFSDHGEETNNFRRQCGRTDMLTDCHKALECQLDVPFIIYLTPRYARLHPGMAARLRSALNRRFMTDDLPQVVCDILGVRSVYVRPERSVINPAYREPAHRRLQNGRLYD